MKNVFHTGNKKEFIRVVRPEDIAQFDSGTVHPVYATFALARDAEWSGRLFVLDMKEEHEEGIGTRLDIQHVSPAFVGQTVRFEACFEEITAKGEIINSFEAFVGERLIAKGRQGQRILPKEKIEKRFNELQA
ncbi:MAG: thioesterase family protein [Chitinophagaceae bacterium]